MNAFGGPPTRVYRMMTNLGPQCGGQQADAATIKVQRIAGIELQACAR